MDCGQHLHLLAFGSGTSGIECAHSHHTKALRRNCKPLASQWALWNHHSLQLQLAGDKLLVAAATIM